MTNHCGKRNTTRYHSRGPITLLPTIPISGDIHANLMNFSEHGISFTASKQMIPGTTILFRASTENYLYSINEAGCQLRSISFVTIKWCQEAFKQGQSIH